MNYEKFSDLPLQLAVAQSWKEKWIVKEKKIFVLVLLRWFYPRNKAAKRLRKCLPSSFVLTMPQQPLLPGKEDVKHIPCTIFLLREELLTIYGKMTKVAFLFSTKLYVLLEDKRNSLKIVCGVTEQKKSRHIMKAIVWNYESVVQFWFWLVAVFIC